MVDTSILLAHAECRQRLREGGYRPLKRTHPALYESIKLDIIEDILAEREITWVTSTRRHATFSGPLAMIRQLKFRLGSWLISS